MNSINKKILGTVIGLSLFAAQSFAALISVAPSEQLVNPGDVFTADIVVSELTDAEDVAALDVDLGFDPEVLQLVSVSFTDALGIVDIETFSGTIEQPGLVNLSSVSLAGDFSAQATSFTFATATFKAIKQGSVSELSLSNVVAGDFYGNDLAMSSKNGSVTVPEPAGVTLLCSSMLMLGSVVFVRRKRS